MSSVARRTVQHAYQDLGVTQGDTAGRVRRMLLVGERSHPIRRLFGESRGVTWIAIMLLAVLGTLIVRPMAMSALSFHRSAALLAERRVEVADLTRRNKLIQQKLKYYKTDAFILERGREYGLVMPGEQAFVVRELTRPEAVGDYARARFRNATSDVPAAIAIAPTAENIAEAEAEAAENAAVAATAG